VLAWRALEAGDGFTVVLNAANEVAVASFMERGLTFPGIPAAIEAALEAHSRTQPGRPATLAEIQELDRWSRTYTEDIIRGWRDRPLPRPVLPA
jgi:1-deoxy-D-xylulose-5-phosphate reductoisomerase